MRLPSNAFRHIAQRPSIVVAGISDNSLESEFLLVVFGPFINTPPAPFPVSSITYAMNPQYNRYGAGQGPADNRYQYPSQPTTVHGHHQHPPQPPVANDWISRPHAAQYQIPANPLPPPAHQTPYVPVIHRPVKGDDIARARVSNPDGSMRPVRYEGQRVAIPLFRHCDPSFPGFPLYDAVSKTRGLCLDDVPVEDGEEAVRRWVNQRFVDTANTIAYSAQGLFIDRAYLPGERPAPSMTPLTSIEACERIPPTLGEIISHIAMNQVVWYERLMDTPIKEWRTNPHPVWRALGRNPHIMCLVITSIKRTVPDIWGRFDYFPVMEVWPVG
ncbi:hypothetical protein C8Q78DRAFT_756720 [Trametes maxima]|nr:hypothetical protein C8Q78DRAFT_756720 [Trametes maxima]